jgi:hypothetical protein
MPNRIFLFGEVGAGKSTICAAISLYFHDMRGWTPRLNAIENPQGTRYLQEWIKQLRRGQFPPKTDRGVFTRIDVGFLDRKKREQVGLTFFEVSGENLRPMNPADPDHAKRSDKLDAWLDEADTILLVGSSNPGENDRYAFQNFIEYIDYKKIDKPIALVISEWDKLDDSSRRSPVEVASRLYGEAAKLLADRFPSSIIPFSIGAVQNEDTITSLDFNAGTHQLVLWILDTIRQRN